MDKDASASMDTPELMASAKPLEPQPTMPSPMRQLVVQTILSSQMVHVSVRQDSLS